jgi:hypothetical protein
MGIIFLRDHEPYVFEASATVKYTPLGVWIARGQGGGFVVKRLRSELTPAQIEKLRAATPPFEGRPYESPELKVVAQAN